MTDDDIIKCLSVLRSMERLTSYQLVPRSDEAITRPGRGMFASVTLEDGSTWAFSRPEVVAFILGAGLRPSPVQR